MDLEGIAKKLLPDEEAIRKKLKEEIEFYKGTHYPLTDKLIEAIIKEVKSEVNAKGLLFEYFKTGAKAGDSGLGSRGTGDFLIHNYLFNLSGRPLYTFDDAGVAKNVVVSIDGIHSRLSYFPFLAGFHVTKATLRDIMTKGAEPLGIIIDIHLSDDSDIGMLFDFEAGVATISKALDVPILAGSTLRIGGDLVIGERISGAVGSVGILKGRFYSRANIEKGMYVVMSEGNGGGTITTTAIYNGFYDVVYETISIKDLLTCKVVQDEVPDKVVAMTDVTNGGIRGDAREINKIKNVSIIINEKKFNALVNPKVLEMLNKLNIDVYGISIDSIMIFTKEPDVVLASLRSHNIRADIVGEVVDGREYPLYLDDNTPLLPRFRESPYTPVKAVIGNYSPYTLDELDEKLKSAFQYEQKKISTVLERLKLK
ncbi:MAG: AIR synthase-related protein [Sulfolobaceae archaeon]|nr:AIR synthase-related protein [Sulfolobaceae archaeon]